MEMWLWNIVAVMAVSVIAAGVIIPQILLISFRRKLFDMPDARKIHTSAVPRLGGLAFMPVVCFAMALVIGVDLVLCEDKIIGLLENDARTLALVTCSIIVVYIVGLADDLIGVRFRAKFVAQILAACFMIAGGVWIDNLHGLFFLHELPYWAAWPLTVLVIVFIVNAINLIDGIDGLASGLSSIATLYFGCVFVLNGEYLYSLLAFSTLGVLMQFFYYNVFGKAERQKKIFMGDTGSLSIGMMICFLSIKCLQSPMPRELAMFGANAFVVAFSPLIIPCFDVIRVYFYRIRKGNSPFLPDQNHLHHRLLQLGFKQRKAMIIIVLSSLVITAMNVWLSTMINVNILLVIDAICSVVAMRIISLGIGRRSKRLNLR